VPTALVRRPESRTLPDGSIVELREGAKIAVDFSGPLRRVTLQAGEAHFQVVKDREHPFVVSAGGVETRAVGTAFLVELNARAVEVLVTQGRVAVSRTTTTPTAIDPVKNPPAEPAGNFEPLLLDAGRHVVVDPGKPGAQLVTAEMAPTELAERLAWRSVRLEFSGTPLAQAVALMNRSGGGADGHPQITLVIDPASPGLAAEPVSGLFRADNAETFVRMLQLSLGVEVERRGESEIVLHKAK
jgi:transmembrane sensor